MPQLAHTTSLRQASWACMLTGHFPVLFLLIWCALHLLRSLLCFSAGSGSAPEAKMKARSQPLDSEANLKANISHSSPECVKKAVSACLLRRPLHSPPAHCLLLSKPSAFPPQKYNTSAFWPLTLQLAKSIRTLCSSVFWPLILQPAKSAQVFGSNPRCSQDP